MVSGTVALLFVAIAATVEVSGRIEDEGRFESLVQRTRDAISHRMDTYVAVLRAGAGLFLASEDVTAEEFRSFCAQLELQGRYPGIQGVGFSRRLRTEQRDAFEEAVRNARDPGFRVWPAGERDEYHAIVYLEPLDVRNRAAIGYDMFTEPVRREAMERARDSGSPAASGRVTLVQEIDRQKQAGFLVYVPVYAGERHPATVEERRAALAGFVYSPFRADDLLRGILGTVQQPGLAFRIYAGRSGDPEALLQVTGVPGEEGECLTTNRTMVVAGFPWEVVFATEPAFFGESRRNLALPVLAVGVFLAVVMFLLTRAEVGARAAAEHAVELHREADRSLQERTEMFKDLTETIEQVFWITRRGDRPFVYVSPAFERIWSRGRDELAEDPDLWLRSVHPEDRDRVRRAIREREENGGYEETYRVVRPDGTVRWVRDRAFPVRGADGAVSRIFGVTEDVTERRQLEEQFLQAQKMEAVGRLAAGVAHDFNNLLTTIVGYADLVHVKLQDRPQAARQVAEIGEAGRRAASLTRQLLTFGRKQVVTPSVQDLNEVVHGVESLLGRLIGPSVRVGLTLFSGPVPVLADRTQLEQVLMNLAVNARDAMPDGGRLTIGTAVVRMEGAESRGGVLPRGEYAELRVADTGVGMTESVLRHAFEPFFTTKGPGKGTGLGLATVFGIVTQAGGDVSVESQEGRGTAFRILLPLHEAPQEPRVEGADDAAPELPPLRVLLVDDEEGVREYLRTTLESAGVRVTPVASVPEALEAWERAGGAFDLLVTDIGLVGPSGLNLASQLLALQPELRVLFVSGYSDAVVRDGGRSLPAGTHYLAKPVGPREFLRKVAELFPGSAG